MALLAPDLLTANAQTFRGVRNTLKETLLQEGVVGSGDFKVTPDTPSLAVQTAAGGAWVQGDDTARQGLYHIVNDAAVTGTTVTAGHATLPRIDQIMLRVFDSSVTGASDTPALQVLTGTATAGATLDNRNGAAGLSNTALRLADILVPAAHTGVIPGGNIRDRRPWARGAFAYVEGQGGGDSTTTSTSFTGTPLSGFATRIECGGSPVLVQFVGSFWNGTAGQSVSLRLTMDGTLIGLAQIVSSVVSAASERESFSLVGIQPAPSAASHSFAIEMSVSGGTGSVSNSGGVTPKFTIEELVRPNANNN